MDASRGFRVVVNGRVVPPGDVRVTQPARLEEKIRWASYMFREFGAWPGEARDNGRGVTR